MWQFWFKVQSWGWSSPSLRRGRGDTLPHSSSCLELSSWRFWRSLPTPRRHIHSPSPSQSGRLLPQNSFPLCTPTCFSAVWGDLVSLRFPGILPFADLQHSTPKSSQACVEICQESQFLWFLTPSKPVCRCSLLAGLWAAAVGVSAALGSAVHNSSSQSCKFSSFSKEKQLHLANPGVI